MKIEDALEKILVSPNGSSREPIFEKYDKNVQGNTVWERGTVASSIIAPFRDFPELPAKESRISVAMATGGNPFLAKISARIAAEHAVTEAVVKVSCVGGTPLAVTDCLNFGNPEKPEQMGELVDGIEGLKKACTAFDVPIVSGNVSLYNESGGKSIPPSALVTVFARVDRPAVVPKLAFQKVGETIFCIGDRSGNLGGSALLEIAGKKDSRIPEIDFPAVKKWTEKLQQVAALNIVSTARQVAYGGLLTAVTESCFGKKLGAELQIKNALSLRAIPSLCHAELVSASQGIPIETMAEPQRVRDDTREEETPRNDRGEGEVQFLFSEDPGAIIATVYPEKIREIFGEEAMEIGKVIKDFHVQVSNGAERIVDKNLTHILQKWDNQLREIL